jgi:lysyl-tRNA synthetase class 2
VGDIRQKALKKRLSERARIVQAIRSFFIGRGFLEVDTPLRLPGILPEAHIDAEESGTWFLQTSPESCMKRLMASGLPKIFQICKCFRQNERGSKHLPEMTLLEWYEEGKTYLDLMVRCEELIRFVAEAAGCSDALSYSGRRISLKDSWERLSVEDAFNRYTSMDVNRALETGAFDACMGLEIEPRLGIETPLFLIDYPPEKGAFAKIRPGYPPVAERFELYIAGLELCNAFTELTDPVEQRERFSQENGSRESMGKRAYPMPEKFLDALEDMPEAAGAALGVDRLVMLLTDSPHIDDVTAFAPEEL